VRTRRFFDALLGHRLLALLLLLAATGALGQFAARVRPDSSIEAMFPFWDPVRQVYDRYKDTSRFPYDDARALVIAEGPDLWTPAGLARVATLEAELRGVTHVADVEGPLSAKDVGGADGEIHLEKVFPRADLDQAEIARRVAKLRADPLFAWSLLHPTRDVATISVVIEPAAAANHDGREAFYNAATQVVRAHEKEWTRLVLTGVPAIRARYIESIHVDTQRLLPIAVLVILVILAITYRSPRVLVAALVTIIASILWTTGVMGIFGVPFGVLTSFAPIIVMVISISDTVHIVSDVDERLHHGLPRSEAVPAAMTDCAGPCLLTEIVVAAGFLSLAFVNIVAILEFGLVTAAGMMLTWIANVTVLPLFLSTGPERPYGTAGEAEASKEEHSGAFLRGFRRFVAWVEVQVVRRPRVVVACGVAIMLAATFAAAKIRVLHYVFDDLRPRSALFQDLRYSEGAHGGLVPVVVYLEPTAEMAARSEAPALEPEALAFLSRAEARLRALPAVKATTGLATYLRRAHGIFVGDDPELTRDGLPATRSLAFKEVELLDDQHVFRDILSFDRKAAAVVALVPDMASPDVAALMGALKSWVAAEAPKGYDVQVTGVLAIADEVAQLLVGGLLQSFAMAIIVSGIVFMIVLRSARLAVIGLIPNVTPMVLMLGIMALLGVDLKPSTVLLFSIALTISDDDTIQYLARFRRRYPELRDQGHPAPHVEATLEVLRESALPMIVTATTIAAGFLVLMLSEFQGTSNLGLTLFSAVFADIFITPIIIMKWRPDIGGRRKKAAEPAHDKVEA
jgi:predicted RND superfamily exporter protein